MTSDRTAPCPNCKQPAPLGPDNRWRPFCSERCKMSDLGGWFAGRYSIPADDDEEPPAVPDKLPQSRQ